MATAIGALLLAGFMAQGNEAGEGAAASDGAIPWRTDLDAACAEAKPAGRPLFVVFRCER